MQEKKQKHQPQEKISEIALSVQFHIDGCKPNFACTLLVKIPFYNQCSLITPIYRKNNNFIVRASSTFMPFSRLCINKSISNK